MKLLPKIESVRRWLKSGKTLTQRQCSARFNYDRLADGVHVLKKRGWDIVNLNRKPNFAKYKLRS